MTTQKKIVIIGGNAGAKIATHIFTQTHPSCSIEYVECFCEEIKSNIIYDSLNESLEYLKKQNVEYFIATGDNNQRRNHYEKIKSFTGKEPLNCIHPSVVLEGKKIGYGNLICPNATIHIDSIIGNLTIINTGSVIEHDCVVSDFSQVSPNVTLCGYVNLDESCFIGAGSTLIPKIHVGKNSVIAAGSVVIKNVPDNVMVAGVPSKIKKLFNEKD